MNEPRQDVYRIRSLLGELEQIVRPLPAPGRLDGAVSPPQPPKLPPTGRRKQR